MSREISESQLQRELKSLERQEKFDAAKTQNNKKMLINDLKNGLGEEIKLNPSGIEVIEKPKETFKEKLIRFFKRF